MLNIEKFKEDIRERGFGHVYMEHHDAKGYEDEENLIDWLCEEYKEPILDDVEKEYLSAVIKPFRNIIEGITKYSYENGFEYIVIEYNDNCFRYTPFPTFKEGTMYKGMRLGKEYTLEELRLYVD